MALAKPSHTSRAAGRQRRGCDRCTGQEQHGLSKRVIRDQGCSTCLIHGVCFSQPVCNSHPAVPAAQLTAPGCHAQQRLPQAGTPKYIVLRCLAACNVAMMKSHQICPRRALGRPEPVMPACQLKLAGVPRHPPPHLYPLLKMTCTADWSTKSCCQLGQERVRGCRFLFLPLRPSG